MSTTCFSCAKKVYDLEKITAGANHYHKFCFKCETCNQTLNLKNSIEKGGHLFCDKHVPKDAPTPTADRHDLNKIKNTPKVAVVNEQFRGELVGQKTNLDLESASIKNAQSAPKVGVVNEQVRGELAGQKTNFDNESITIKNAKAAPKVGVVNEQVRNKSEENLLDKSQTLTQKVQALKMQLLPQRSA
eukprot:TRINITY_DN37_c0_g1_i10.p1 TRINITY_DN37_c0_g1~~TRINITY_DN37_c0_g1_i10.p1  ORF type:complete len:188 (-),score=38.55 TRINITY_DN37_c0_g1_i10:288-851(-)